MQTAAPFTTPTKTIVTEADLERFKKSPCFQDIMGYIYKLTQSVESKPISSTKLNPKFNHIIDFLDQVEKTLQEVPPIEQQMRFGNQAFRTFLEKIEIHIDKVLTHCPKGSEIELKVYLQDSFGNKQRIDYGTGHELAFVFFLLCLFKLNYYGEEDFESVVRNLFYKYIDVIRKVQLQYMLEPAGSHGVWGLDDYQFLPFLFGSSELINNPSNHTPETINKETIVKMNKEEYQFYQCIDFINTVKKGPFHEHSPILFSMTSVPTWTKVTSGLVKMYQGEVLFKHPVIKHAYFGSLISFQ